jgi:hypothetical protein
VQPAVKAKGVGGFLGINFAGPVTMTIGANPAGGVLAGTTVVGASSGTAAFSGLRIDRPGVGYTLVASATGLAPAASTAFDVARAVPTNMNQCKNGAWVYLARMNGTLFKNQGDCVSYTNNGK